MFLRLAAMFLAIFLLSSTAEARRVAMVIGQGSYNAGLTPLPNPQRDARRMAKILADHGFEVHSCDGQSPGCYNQTRAGLQSALSAFKAKADGAELAVIFYAGHGLETQEGNILAPVDAGVNCATWQVTNGVRIDAFLAAASPARHKVVILDACRDNPLGQICPPPRSRQKMLSFADIKVPEARDFLLITSTKPGQQAQDGPAGGHSPFAAALFEVLESASDIYFDQVFNRVAKAVIETTRASAFTQLPEMIARGGMPEACLKAGACQNDLRAAALTLELDLLRKERARDQELAGIASDYITVQEQQRGRPLDDAERQRALAEVREAVRDAAARNDQRGEQALAALRDGDASSAEQLFEEVLQAEAQEAQRLAERTAARKREAAKAARHIAALAKMTNKIKAAEYYKRAVELDPAHAGVWYNYAWTATAAGRLAEAKSAFAQAAKHAQEVSDVHTYYWATLGMGDSAIAEGSVKEARLAYEAAAAIAKSVAEAVPDNIGLQREIAVSQSKIGDVMMTQGDRAAAVAAYKAALAIMERLAASDALGERQRDLSIAQDRIGDVLRLQGDLAGALTAYRGGLALRERLALADPGDKRGQRDLAVSQMRIGRVLVAQDDLAGAMTALQAGRDLVERLAGSDPSNVGWQRDLAVFHDHIGNVLVAQAENRKGGLGRPSEDWPSEADNPGVVLDLHDALAAYRAGQAIRERLAVTDPGNTERQRDLAISQEKIGKVLLAQGDLAGALAAHQASLAIIERLAASDPANTGWQRDLSESRRRMGNALVAKGDLAGALAAYQAGLAIIERLAAMDAGNFEWQHDLALSHAHIGSLFARLGERDRARASFQNGRALIEQQRSVSPDQAALPRELAWFDRQIALMKAQP